jgi:heparosan-N-sulfate-glucuronate 5-epimerase
LQNRFNYYLLSYDSLVSCVIEKYKLVGLALFVILSLSIATVMPNISASVKDSQDRMENQIDQAIKYRSSLSNPRNEISELSNDKIIAHNSQSFSPSSVKLEDGNHPDTSTQKTLRSSMDGFDSIFMDENGIPYVDYDKLSPDYLGIGIQRNPVTVVHAAMDFYNAEDTKFFINNVDWLVRNAVPKDGFSTFEYTFDWPVYDLEQPWRSALANGGAVIPLVKAHQITGNAMYLYTAKQLLNSFLVEVEDSGVTYKDSDESWWYEEYVADNEDAKESRVLNGMLYALIAVYEYYKYTDDMDAKLIFDKGVNSVKENLAKYDNGKGYSYYDILGNPANNYHLAHVELLNKLYDITNEDIFREYSEKWSEQQDEGDTLLPLPISHPLIILHITGKI